jgi:hypothetical protein
MRIGLCPVLGLLLLTAGCGGRLPVQSAPPLSPSPTTTVTGAQSDAAIAREAILLRTALIQQVPQHILGNAADESAWLGRAKATMAAEAFKIERAQLLVVVDRNPAVQELRIVLARPDAPWEVIGGSKVSTGQAGRRGYFITPVGVFQHTGDILDYRALGTFNENHIRGLGLKGMRVWDFGWQTAARGWHAERDMSEMRLLMHATDPDYLEQRLGRPASQGCIRIPATMNRFLDVHGVLDVDYERAATDDARMRSILLPEREPSPLGGNTLVVMDSAEGG